MLEDKKKVRGRWFRLLVAQNIYCLTCNSRTLTFTILPQTIHRSWGTRLVYYYMMQRFWRLTNSPHGRDFDNSDSYSRSQQACSPAGSGSTELFTTYFYRNSMGFPRQRGATPPVGKWCDLREWWKMIWNLGGMSAVIPTLISVDTPVHIT